MKRMVSQTKLYLAIMVLAVSILAISTVAMGEDSHKAITQDLIKLIETNPEIGVMLEESIAKAKGINPDRQTNPVQNLSEYYDFIDSTSELIPQDVLDDPANLTHATKYCKASATSISWLTSPCLN